MSDAGAGFGCRDCRAAGVGEEVQYFDLAPRGHGVLNDPAEPVPVDGLFREQTGVFEVKRFESEGEIPVVDRPLLGQVPEFPLAAAFVTAVVMAVGISPFSSAGSLPDHLRVRTDQFVAAPELEFLSVRSIQYLIVFPGIRNPHNYFCSSNVSPIQRDL